MIHRARERRTKGRGLTSQVTEKSGELEVLGRPRTWWGGSDEAARWGRGWVSGPAPRTPRRHRSGNGKSQQVPTWKGSGSE